MIENKFEMVDDPADPNRCQGINSGKYQCLYKAVEGTKFCARHSAGTMQKKAEAKQAEYNYQLNRYRSRVIEFAENPKVKNLRDEVGVLRLLLETIVNRCNDDTNLMIYAGKISELVMKIDKVVTSCHSIEAKTGQVLDKTTVVNLAEGVVQILTKYVTDSEVLGLISNDITALLQSSVMDPLSV